MRRWASTAVLAVGAGLLGACGGAPPATSDHPPRPTSSVPPGSDGLVTRHVDGDTIDVDGDRVRLIGVDTPETHYPGLGVECYGRTAAAETARLLPVGTKVRLGYDVERHDRYGRTLAYVYRASDGLFVNAYLAEHGYASTLTIPPNVTHARQFVRLSRSARTHHRGLWAACPGGNPSNHSDSREAGPTLPQRPTGRPTSGASGGRCDPHYSGACIPPPPPDLDCSQIDARGFEITGADPHRFDRDGDGVACEGL